jgi:serine/threonine protein phosphatase 1
MKKYREKSIKRENVPNHYVIGDVHGEYQTLLALVERLPQDAKLVFVGDLVDRGSQSKEVIAFIQEQNYQTVMGNHEALFCKYGLEFLSYLEGDKKYEQIDQRWHTSGRFETFLSYGVVNISAEGVFTISAESRAIERLRKDIEWMRKRAIYLELETLHSSGKPVLISHSNISKVWNIRNDKEKSAEFFQTTLWTREHETDDEVEIFNIFGHCPQGFEPKVTDNYVCVDTGCCYIYRKSDHCYGRLSAYCVETGEVVVQENVG